MTEYPDFKSFLNDKVRERGLTLRRLSEISGISVKHLEDLASGDASNLPEAPYLRGYLRRLAQILDFDAELWLQRFRDAELNRSGPSDELPRNRFAPRPITKYLWLALVLGVVLLYLGFRFQKILGKPTLTLSYPPDAVVRVMVNAVTISGKIEGGGELFVNSEAVPVASDGTWGKTLTLEPGLNTVEIRAKKFLGKETKIIRQIVYEPTGESPRGDLEATSSEEFP